MKTTGTRNGIKSFFLGVGIVLSSLVAGAPSPQAAEPGLLAGSHVGRLNDDQEIHLLMRPLSERRGSYLGLLMIKGEAMQLYRVDPLDGNLARSFAMNPLEIGRDGEIGVLNIDPSLVLSIGRICPETGRPDFTITSANNGNMAGFRGSMIFKARHESDLFWGDFLPGEFRDGDNRVMLTALDQHEAAFFSEQAGSFVIREKISGVFLVRKVSVRSTGASLDTQPAKIAVFIHEHTLLGQKVRLVLANPSNFRNVSALKFKR